MSCKKYQIGKTRFENIGDKYIEVIAPSGSLLICDTKCLHRGKPIRSGERYAITLYVCYHGEGADKHIKQAQNK